MEIIFVSGQHCHACHAYHPIITSVAKDARIPLRELSCEDDCVEVGRLNINALPTTIVLERGIEVTRWEGAFNPQSTLRRIQEAACVAID